MYGTIVCDEANKTKISQPTNSRKECPTYSAIKYIEKKIIYYFILIFYILLLVFNK